MPRSTSYSLPHVLAVLGWGGRGIDTRHLRLSVEPNTRWVWFLLDPVMIAAIAGGL